MSIETLSVILGFVSVLVSFAAGCVWTVHRMDVRFDQLIRQLDDIAAKSTRRFDNSR